MTDKQTKTIVDGFTSHNMPENVQTDFGKWLVDSDNISEKESAMEELWNRTEPQIDADSKSRIWAQFYRRTNSRKRSLWRIAAVAASVAVVLTASLAIQRSVLIGTIEPEVLNNICYVTSSDSKGSFTLPDGSKVWLNAGSRLECPEQFFGRRRCVSLTGEGYFEVAKDAEHPFVVSMGNCDIEVLGTEFDVKSYKGESEQEIVLCEGSVKVLSRGFQPMTLSPNERLVISSEKNSVQLDKVDAENYRRWIQPSLKMDNFPMPELLVNLGRWFNMKFIVSPSLDTSPRLSFHIKYESAEEVMRAMAMVVPVSYRFDYAENTVYIYPQQQRRR